MTLNLLYNHFTGEENYLRHLNLFQISLIGEIVG